MLNFIQVATPSTTSSSNRRSFAPKTFDQQVLEYRKKMDANPAVGISSFEYNRKTMWKPKINNEKLIKAYNYTKPESKFATGMLWTKLKTGWYGIVFKDGSEFIISQDLFQFQIKNDAQTWQLFDFSEYPESHKEKVYLICYMLNLYQTKSVKLLLSRPSNFDENFTSKSENIDLKKLKIGKFYC